MGIRAAISNITVDHTAPEGFDLESPDLVLYCTAQDFSEALQQQRDDIVILPASDLKEVGIDGAIAGTEWKLSKAAFSDLCNFTGMPQSFIKRLAVISESTAMEVIRDVVRSSFQGATRELVIDTRLNRVEGIVGKDTYSHISNAEAFEYVLSASPGLSLSRGGLCGPSMRATFIDRNRPLEPRKGDIIHTGCDLLNNITGQSAIELSGYLERLVCTNGAVARTAKHYSRIEHRSDVVQQMQSAAIRLSQSLSDTLPLLRRATTYAMGPQDIDTVREFLRSPRGGGSATYDQRITLAAMAEARAENRPEEETTLWNWHNAVTADAKTGTSFKRQAQFEAVGFEVLQHALAN